MSFSELISTAQSWTSHWLTRCRITDQTGKEEERELIGIYKSIFPVAVIKNRSSKFHDTVHISILIRGPGVFLIFINTGQWLCDD